MSEIIDNFTKAQARKLTKFLVAPDRRLQAPRRALSPIVKGRRACPPEDVGGIYGHYEFLRAIEDPGYSDHEYMLEWIGGDFDPGAFHLEDANQALEELAREGPS